MPVRVLSFRLATFVRPLETAEGGGGENVVVVDISMQNRDGKKDFDNGHVYIGITVSVYMSVRVLSFRLAMFTCGL